MAKIELATCGKYEIEQEASKLIMILDTDEVKQTIDASSSQKMPPKR